MKKHRMVLGTAVLTAILLTPQISSAQHGMGGPGPGRVQQHLYDTTTVQTIHGEVVAVDSFTGARGISAGVHVTLKSDSGSVSIHIGPEWYLAKQSVKIEKGDMITVVGSGVILQGKPAVVAAEVRKGDQTLRLRDRQGYPVWSRRQR